VSRASLTLLAAAALVAAGGAAGAAPSALDPHLDRSLVPGSCQACHRGHGMSRSPMLPAPQKQVCLVCHDSQAKRDRMISEGVLDAAAEPTSLASTFSQPYTHPLTDGAFSRFQPDAVTCSSCHSPHRGSFSRTAGPERAPGKKVAPNDPTRFEYEVCESCHGHRGVTTSSLVDISRLLNANSRSSHPVENVSTDSSPSLLPAYSGKEISCTDCHGNSDPAGPKGPHGSAVRYILSGAYSTVDGVEESRETYRLCYACHEREKVLDSNSFPEHRLHVVDQRASCATCHDPHGSVDNRSLIRFGEETSQSSALPSIAAGRIAFESDAPGAGACYLTCHGYDHAPATYGADSMRPLTDETRPGRAPRDDRPPKRERRRGLEEMTPR